MASRKSVKKLLRQLIREIRGLRQLIENEPTASVCGFHVPAEDESYDYEGRKPVSHSPGTRNTPGNPAHGPAPENSTPAAPLNGNPPGE